METKKTVTSSILSEGKWFHSFDLRNWTCLWPYNSLLTYGLMAPVHLLSCIGFVFGDRGRGVASATPSPSRIDFGFSRTPSIDTTGTTDTTNFQQPSSLERVWSDRPFRASRRPRRQPKLIPGSAAMGLYPKRIPRARTSDR